MTILTGKSSLDYFNAFKCVVRAAAKDGYFRINPSIDIKGKSNASKKLKDFLESEELIALINTPIFNQEVKMAFVICCYTGLRWCDIQTLSWSQIRYTKKGVVLQTRIIQAKTGKPVEITLHPIALPILEEKRKQCIQDHQNSQPAILTIGEEKQATPWGPEGRIFTLPIQDGAKLAVAKWGRDAVQLHDLEELATKHITWHSARLTFSILLQDAGVDPATVALLLGHTTTKYVLEVYKRHRPRNQMSHLSKLPHAQWKVE